PCAYRRSPSSAPRGIAPSEWEMKWRVASTVGNSERHSSSVSRVWTGTGLTVAPDRRASRPRGPFRLGGAIGGGRTPGRKGADRRVTRRGGDLDVPEQLGKHPVRMVQHR